MGGDGNGSGCWVAYDNNFVPAAGKEDLPPAGVYQGE